MSKITRCNYEYVIKEIAEVRSCLDGRFENQSIDNLKYMYEAIESLLNQWDYLDKDIEEMFHLLEDNNLI